MLHYDVFKPRAFVCFFLKLNENKSSMVQWAKINTKLFVVLCVYSTLKCQIHGEGAIRLEGRKKFQNLIYRRGAQNKRGFGI